MGPRMDGKCIVSLLSLTGHKLIQNVSFVFDVRHNVCDLLSEGSTSCFTIPIVVCAWYDTAHEHGCCRRGHLDGKDV